ncbi:MAG: tRNA pseudouridine(38-40) synthase TruA [Chloroflexota bacterium]|nr:tRNA pseudouridine(38-40) synthase TruA [Chloroflexota bacterium]
MVEYDGTDYFGFQIQPDRPTIQGCLESVLAKLSGEKTRLRYAGRTDTGVHASGQVISAMVNWRHSISDLERAWNALLPNAVAVRSLERVIDPSFHPRFAARSRIYRYRVWTAAWRSPLQMRFAHHEPKAPDVEAMNRAGCALLGSHDFASFGQPTHGDITIRKVVTATWTQEEQMLQFEIEANAFLKRMVRTVVGTLLEIGKGMRPEDDIVRVLAARDRTMAAQPAPPQGLRLAFVRY